MPSYPLNTTVQLLHDVPLSPNSGNSIRFTSAAARESYFAGKVFNSYAEIQYMRDDGRYRLNMNYDETLANCNYMRYRNQSTGRWYYCYITSISYANPNVCWIDFQIDTYMTFQFDLVWKDCFIERECVSDDTVGSNTIAEDVYLGEHIYSNYPTTFPIAEGGNIKLMPVLFLSAAYRIPEAAGEYTFNKVTNNLPQSLVVWSGTRGGTPGSWQNQLNAFLDGLAQQSKLDAIIAGSFLPEFVLEKADSSTVGTGSTAGLYGYYYDFSDAGIILSTYEQDIDLKWGTSSYKNNKLYTYPYSYFFLTNNNGDKVDILPQYMAVQSGESDYTKRKITLNFLCDISPTPVLTAYPTDYQGGELSTHSTTLQNFPTLATTGDAYINWLSGHTASILYNIGSNIVNMGVSSALQNPQGMISSAGGVIETLTALEDRSKIPAEVKTMPGNIGNYAAKKFEFSIVKCQLKAEVSYMIDNYFSMYGYKVNRLGTPEFGTRQYWNFYKIPICNVYADIPSEYLEDIRTQFQNGITLWNTTDVGNYNGGINPII